MTFLHSVKKRCARNWPYFNISKFQRNLFFKVDPPPMALMEPHIGAKFQKNPALGYGDTQDRTDGRTNWTEFQGPISPRRGTNK